MANNEATKDNIKNQRRHPITGKLIAAVKDTPLKPVMDALNSTLRAIRELHPDLPNVVLVVGASGRKSPTTLALGHFAPKSWDSKGVMHEVAISGEVLKQGAEGVLETLLHEMAHNLAAAREVKDTSRQGRFHNKRFKLLAEELGLVVPESSSSIGWSNARLTDMTKKQYQPQLAELRKVLKLYRLPNPPKESKPKSTVKIECGCRSVTVPISFVEKGELHCLECARDFEPVGSDAEEGEEQ